MSINTLMIRESDISFGHYLVLIQHHCKLIISFIVLSILAFRLTHHLYHKLIMEIKSIIT